MSQLSISAREAMNRFLIEDFNYILRAEEKALSAYGGRDFPLMSSTLSNPSSGRRKRNRTPWGRFPGGWA